MRLDQVVAEREFIRAIGRARGAHAALVEQLGQVREGSLAAAVRSVVLDEALEVLEKRRQALRRIKDGRRDA